MDDVNVSLKAAKEQFVSNLNGTTWQEIDGVLMIAPVCVMLLTAVSQLLTLGSSPSTSSGHENKDQYTVSTFLMSFTVLILPLLFGLTVWSDHMTKVLQALVMITFLVICTCFNVQPVVRIAWCTPMNHVQSKPYISWYRAYVNILTAICILAVDFHIYPRRLAKTETYGTGLMDIFVGCFIMCNSIVCREATNDRIHFRNFSDKITSIWRVFKSCLPLTVLGIARLVSTKASDYQEHVTEYGVHWNFFMTLAVTRMVCTLIMCIISPRMSILLALSFAGVYQYLLSTRLSDYILRSGGRHDDFISANREGIFSTMGYMSLYFTGVAIGQFLFQTKRLTIGDHIKHTITLLLVSLITLGCALLVNENVEEISRRLANLSFILWTIHHSMLVLAMMMVVYILQYILDIKGGLKMSTFTMPLLGAVNFNGLLYFLLANLLTGLVNLSINTLSMNTIASVAIVTAYLLILNYALFILYVNDISTKFW